jgi:hypothetical protein
VILGIISSSLGGIFNTALYYYAITEQVPTGYSQDLIRNAFVKSKAAEKSDEGM